MATQSSKYSLLPAGCFMMEQRPWKAGSWQIGHKTSHKLRQPVWNKRGRHSNNWQLPPPLCERWSCRGCVPAASANSRGRLVTAFCGKPAAEGNLC